MPARNADRNLLFGILALQMGFITREALIDAMAAWVMEKHRPIGEILVDRSALEPKFRDLLEPMIDAHVERHQGDPTRSLAALSSIESAASALRHSISDPEILASITFATRAPSPDMVASRASGPAERLPPELRYRKVRDHAKGGLGVVFVAHDHELGREVALKEIQDRHADHPEHRAKFLLEAEITGGLEHPGIVPVYGLGSYDDGRPFYAMRFIKGESLKSAIAAFHADESFKNDPGGRALALQKLLRRFLDVCNAIAYAHSRGVLHRDLKPDNVMVGKYGETLVVDWGLAKATGRPGVDSEVAPHENTLSLNSASGSAETLPGSVVGTPAYMSPEQAAGRLDLLGPTSDVYSLGATLYTLLTGHVAFADRDLAGLLRKVEHGEFPRPRETSPWLAPALEAICLKAMALRPDNRYPSPRALAEDVEHWLADEPVSAHPDSIGTRVARWGRRHRSYVLVGAASLAIIVVSSIGLAVERDRYAQGLSQAGEATKAALASAEAERDRVKQENRRARQSLADVYLERGRAIAENDDGAQGVLWLSKALELAPPDDTTRVDLIRRNLATWDRQVHPLRGIALTPSRVFGVSSSPDSRSFLTLSQEDPSVRIWRVGQGQPVGQILGQPGLVLAASFSPDGKLVLTAGVDGKARLWDVTDGSPVGSPMAHQGSIQAASFSPDGRTIATGGDDRVVRIWDVASRSPLGPPLAHPAQVLRISFSPDGRTIATASADNLAWLWDVSGGNPIAKSLTRVKRNITFLKFRPDGRAILTGSIDGDAQLWDVASGSPIGPPLPHPGGAFHAVFRADGKALITAALDNMGRFWDLDASPPVARLLPHQGSIRAISISPDGQTALTGSQDNTARLWSFADGAPIGLPMPHQGPVMAVGFGHDGKTVLTGCVDGTARIWGITETSEIVLPGHRAWKTLEGFSLDRTTLVGTGPDGAARIWSVANGSPVGRAMSHPSGPVERIAFAPDFRIVATVCDREVRLWDATGLPIGRPLVHPEKVWSVTFSPDAKVVLTDCHNGPARLWSVADGSPVGREMPHPPGSNRANAFAPDGQTIAFMTGREVRMWNATGLPIGRPLIHPVDLVQMTFSPDGKAIVTGSLDGVARLWSVADSSPIGPPMKHGGTFAIPIFSRDGRLILTFGLEGSIRLWRAGAGTPLGRPMFHRSMIHDALFAPDGRTFLISGENGEARLWDVASCSPIGPTIRNEGAVLALAFSPDGKTAMAAGKGGVARLRDASSMIEGDPTRITLKAQVSTGLELDDQGAIQSLSPETWAERRAKLGGPPKSQ